MAKHSHVITVRAKFLCDAMLPPHVISSSFPGWAAWQEGGARRSSLVGFVAEHLQICAIPENLYEPDLVQSPDDSTMFPVQLEAVAGDEGVLVATVPFVFSRKVKPSDLDPESDFSDEYGSLAGIFSIHWKLGEGEFEDALQDSENFSVTMR